VARWGKVISGLTTWLNLPLNIMIATPSRTSTTAAGAWRHFRKPMPIARPRTPRSQEVKSSFPASIASSIPNATWMPRTTDDGVRFATREAAPVAAMSIQTMPMEKPDARIIDGGHCCAIAAAAMTFIGSMGIGSL